MTDMKKAVSASVTMKLKADSGYTSTETHRISANQWNAIVIMAGNADHADAFLSSIAPTEGK